jgi:1-phosphofructokinase
MIITLTLNPAIDEMVEVDHFEEADTNRVLSIRRDIGGKGINVALVLKELGYEPLATGFAPGKFGRMIEEQLLDAGIGCEFVTYPGETRTNINIVDRQTHHHTVLAAPGPGVPPDALARLKHRLLGRMRADTWLVLAGSIPPPLGPDLHIELMREVAARGGASILDADGPVVEEVMRSEVRPILLKMNDHELGRLLHLPLDTERAVLDGARSVQRQGFPNVVITRGGEGTVALTEDGEFRAVPPLVQVQSAVGAGDGFLAGLLLGLKQSRGWLDALALASAVGAAVCLTSGTALCHARDVFELRPFAMVEPLATPSAAR